MTLSRAALGLALLLAAAPTPLADPGEAPFRVSVVVEGRPDAPRTVRLRARLTGRDTGPGRIRWNPARERRYRGRWVRRDEVLAPGGAVDLTWEFPVPSDAPAILHAEVQVRTRSGWRPFRGEVATEADGAWRLRPSVEGGTQIPFRMLALLAPGDLGRGTSVCRSSAEWDELRGRLGLLAPASWGLFPSEEAYLPWPYPAPMNMTRWHSQRAPDPGGETILCVGAYNVAGPAWVRSVEERGDGTLEVRYSMRRGRCWYVGFIPEPACSGVGLALLMAVPATEAPVEFVEVPWDDPL